MSAPLNIAIAGLGNVGGSTLKILSAQTDMLAKRSGRAIRVVAVSARDKKKAASLPLNGIEWADNPLTLASRADIDVVVELIGGAEGVARQLVEASLKNGKHVITANKALIAHHGVALAELAESKNLVLACEAAVAGGIPIIHALRNGLAANQFSRVSGILNGTCNYILTTMAKTGRAFADVLKEAQDLGYAEADPSFDIDGVDAAHKLAILTSLAFGCPVDMKTLFIEGIRNITPHDMKYAAELGYAIKLLGITECGADGVRQRVHPCMVPSLSALGVIDGAFNAIKVEGDAVGHVVFEGPGAGGGPTASAVISDVIDLARGASYKPFTVSVKDLKKLPTASMDAVSGSYYLRLTTKDQPGVLAEITGAFARAQISVQSIIQHTHTADTPAQIVVTTHETQERAMQQALKDMQKLGTLLETPTLIRIMP